MKNYDVVGEIRRGKSLTTNGKGEKKIKHHKNYT
jgi:hypothetical protein